MQLPVLVPQLLTGFLCAVNLILIFSQKIVLGGSIRSIMIARLTGNQYTWMASLQFRLVLHCNIQYIYFIMGMKNIYIYIYSL